MSTCILSFTSEFSNFSLSGPLIRWDKNPGSFGGDVTIAGAPGVIFTGTLIDVLTITANGEIWPEPFESGVPFAEHQSPCGSSCGYEHALTGNPAIDNKIISNYTNSATRYKQLRDSVIPGAIGTLQWDGADGPESKRARIESATFEPGKNLYVWNYNIVFKTVVQCQ